ncbi:MAG: hypothetical protein JJ975_06725 [Bacteroidia bacterium]|nr:hypothetical protein [Bacteroidia bacterium]
MKPGKYATGHPGVIEAYRLQHQHRQKFGDMVVVLLYLRDDGTFLLGGCDYQIRMAGQYLFEEDSLTLFNSYDFLKQLDVGPIRLFADLQTQTIHFNQPIKLIDSLETRYSEFVTVLKLNSLNTHLGFLRNEDWPLDSIRQHNRYLSLKHQQAYIDSVLQATTH